MDESSKIENAPEGITDSHTATDSFDDKLQTLPQGAILDSGYGKQKAAVMRRNVAGRKKPTRQGLRDSLLKSLDESELQTILADVTIGEEDEPDTSTAKEAVPVVPARTHSFKNPALVNLNNDLTNVLRRRESNKQNSRTGVETNEERRGIEERPVKSPVSSSGAVKSDNKDTVSSPERSLAVPELPRVDRTTKPKIINSVPDVVPRRKLPDLTLSTKNTEQAMETSPEHKTPPRPYIKPQLKPIVAPRPHVKDTEEQLAPWANNRLNKIQASPVKEAQSKAPEEPARAPWTPKLRKVEIPTEKETSLEDHPPTLPPRPKIRPTSAIADDRGTDNSNLVMQQESVSVASLPTKTLQSPISNSVRHSTPLPLPEKETSSSTEETQNVWERNLKPVGETAKLRKPKSTNSQPDWIRQAAEKRKRASLLIEQAEAVSSEKDDGETLSSHSSDQNTEPFVQLRFPNKMSSRSSSIDSNSTSTSQPEEVMVPPWKRELHHQNSQRRMERRRKAQTAIEMTTPVLDAGKENRDDSAIPEWRKELKSFNRSSVIDLKEDGESGAEPEFIKMFKKRQERLRKCGSQIIESE